ncbi:hypothetical protein [Flavobacterium sp.]|uniref:hypothetical protein n=1 Tax=Flavobacterium sp. TaxID=239 RepID=UPI0032649072
MKLTLNQIANIERTLLLNGIVYDDIKLELTDHIASEIEAKITENNCNYETAFIEVIESWKNQFKPTTSSFWVGFLHSGPKIYMDKVLKITKNEFKWGAIIIGIGLFVKLFNYDIYLTDEYSTILRTSVKGIVFGSFITFFSGRLFIIKSKIKTTYSEIYKKKAYLIVVYFFMIMVSVYPVSSVYDIKRGHLFSLLFVALYIGYAFNGIRLLRKHLKMQKQFKELYEYVKL